MKSIDEQIREVDKQIEYWKLMESSAYYISEKTKYTFYREVYESIKSTLSSAKEKK